MPEAVGLYTAKDSVTGLLSEPAFRSHTAAFISQMEMPGSHCLIVLNIGNFKAINSRHGYMRGDECLRTMGEVLRSIFPDAILGRLYADHFCGIVRNERIEQAIVAIHSHMAWHYERTSLGIIAGVYVLDNPAVSEKQAIDRALFACRSVKDRFGVHLRYFDDELAQKLSREGYVLNSLEDAIAANDLEVYYQPIVRVISGKICGVEALVRWCSPLHGMLSPATFIPTLESSRFIHKLDAFVVNTACDEFHRIRELVPTASVSVNLSRLDFELCDIFEIVDSAVRRNGMDPSDLDIEITESAFSSDFTLVHEGIDRFRRAGYKIWMDDFGSGYSSLSALTAVPFDTVKIDMSLIRDIDKNPATRTVLSQVIGMVKRLGAHTLTEGVETERQLEFLRSVGCEKAQGYLFSRPAPIGEIVELVQTGGIEAETDAESGYFSDIGRVSLAGGLADAMAASDMLIAGTVPLAVVEVDRGRVRVISQNRPFGGFLAALGVHYFEDLMSENREFGSVLRDRFLHTALEAKTEQSDRAVEFNFGGELCALSVRHVAQANHLDAYLVRAVNLTRLDSADSWDNQVTVRSFVYSLFERIDVIDLATGEFDNIRFMSEIDKNPFARGKVSMAIQVVSEGYVHPDERQLFAAFFELKTMRRRLRSNGGIISLIFRMRLRMKGYRWMRAVITPIAASGDQRVAVCFKVVGVPNVDQGVSSIVGGLATTSLVDAVLSATETKVFWKDEQRRFLGANRAFIDYYGFGSVKDLIGNTDEDMGWHSDPGPFKSDEERVLEGECIHDAHGFCMAHGQERAIVASKMPVYQGGHIVGLLGYFSDITDRV